MTATKIATCCYCGTRAALVLSGERRHELACQACGAQLHDLKMLPKRETPLNASRPHTPHPGRSSHERAMSKINKRDHAKRRKKKSFGRRALSEIFDVIEDIFD